MFAIVAHGGAGRWGQGVEEAAAAVGSAAAAGGRLLATGATALDAVTLAVASMEDSPLLNAGTGSALTLEGRAEMDAGVMTGHDLAAGGVGGLERVRSPVQVARRVLSGTDHVLLTGPGALRFARSQGFTDHDPVTPASRQRWRRLREKLGTESPALLPRLPGLLQHHPELGGDTVGAVALDRGGHLAAATSTGGIMLRLPGRVGDSPLPGAGNFADANCAVSATGLGELMMRQGTARMVAAAVAAGSDPGAAARSTLDDLAARLGSECGLIALDRQGQWAVDHRTPALPAAVFQAGDTHPRLGADRDSLG